MRNSATVGGWTILSRLTGFLRVLVVGALMGPTFLGNVFQAGYVLPSSVFTLMAGPVLAMVVVPALIGAGTVRAAEVLARVAGRLLAVATVCAILLALASPALAWLLVVGVPEPNRVRAWQLAIVLILFVAPQVVLYTVASLGVAAQQARGRFGLAAAAPAVENFGTILTVSVAALTFGTGLEIQQAPMAMIVMLGVGTTASVLLHAGLQAYGARQVGLLPLPQQGWRRDIEASDTVQRMYRSSPVAACPVVMSFLLTVVAGTVVGGVLVIQLCHQVFYALSHVGGRAVATAALPRLSAAAKTSDVAQFAAALRQCLFYATAVSLPPLFLLMAFSVPTADLIANGELRNSRLVGDLAMCLIVAGLAQLVGSIYDLGRQALFARFDDQSLRSASYVSLGVGVGVGLGALLLPAGSSRLTVLATAILAAQIAAVVITLWRLRTIVRPHALTEVGHARATAAGCLAMLPAIVAGSWLLDVLHPDRIPRLGLLVVVGSVSVAGYVLTVRKLAAAT